MQNNPDKPSRYMPITIEDRETSLRVTRELSLAKYHLDKPTQFLAFLILAALVRKNQGSGDIERYTFDAPKMADLMGINQDTGRSGYVASIFRDLQNYVIEIPKFSDKRRPDRITGFSSWPCVAFMDYDGMSKKIVIDLHPAMNEMLYRYKTSGGFISVDEIKVLSSHKNVIRIFILLFGLYNLGHNSIPITDFRKKIELGKAYPTTKQLNQFVLKPAQKYISALDRFKNFTLKTNGKPGKAADRIFFDFGMKEAQTVIDSLSGFKEKLSNDEYEMVIKCSHQRQGIIAMALDEGFDKKYLGVIINSKHTDDEIQADFDRAIAYSRQHGCTKSQTGMNITKAVKDGWTSRDPEKMAKRAEAKAKRDAAKRTREAIAHEEEAKSDASVASKAKKYIEYLGRHPENMDAFLKENDNLRRLRAKVGREPDMSVLYSIKMDKRKKEYKMLLEMVKGYIQLGELDLPVLEQELF